MFLNGTDLVKKETIDLANMKILFLSAQAVEVPTFTEIPTPSDQFSAPVFSDKPTSDFHCSDRHSTSCSTPR